MIRHNHMTRDIKPFGKCPACDEYLRAVESFDEAHPTMAGTFECIECTKTKPQSENSGITIPWSPREGTLCNECVELMG